MTEEKIRKHDFAMPPTNPAFPPGPYRFVHREYLTTCRTNPDRLRPFVPEPLAIDGPLASYEFIRIPDSTKFGDTGAASGISKEIARAYLHEGAKVVIGDLDKASAHAAAAELGAENAIGIAVDVTSEVQVEAGMAKAVSSFGRLDVLVSNAGIQIVAPLEDLDLAKWKQMLAIHLDGAFLAMPPRRANKRKAA